MIVPNSAPYDVRSSIQGIIDRILALERRIESISSSAPAQELDSIRKDVSRLKRIPTSLDFNDVFRASGPAHAMGYVPDPGSVAGSTRFLCENGVWRAP